MSGQNFEGDFELRTLKLYPVVQNSYGNSIDIKDIVGEITLKESVLSASLYCSIVVKDIEENLISKLPMMGQERIEMVVRAGSKQIKQDFYVYNIDGRVMKEKNQGYVLHCCSLEALKNESQRIVKRLDGVKAHEFVEENLRTITNKKINVEESLHKFDMYIPNWRLFDTCAWFRTRTVATAHKDSVGYLFWESFDGFNFKSVDTLFDQDPYPNKSTRYGFAQGNTDLSESKFRIINYASPKVFNVFDDARSGSFAHDAIYIDPNHRTARIFRTTADDFWSKSKHLGGLKPYRSGGNSEDLVDFSRGSGRVVYRPSTINTFGKWNKDQPIGDRDMVDESNKIFEKSIYRFYFMQYNTLDIAVPGDLDVRAGNLIDVDIPEPRVNKDAVKKDKRISGKYLVNSITHVLNRDKLSTRITLTRDSFGGTNIADDKRTEKQVTIGS